MNENKIIKLVTVVLLVSLFTLSGCYQTAVNEEGIDSEVAIQKSIEETKITEETSEATESKTEEENNLPTRAENKSILISIEGMQEEESFKLLSNTDMRISTYIPSNYLTEVETFDDKELIQIYTNEQRKAAIIIYAIDGHDAEQMEQITTSYFENLGYEDISESNIYSRYEGLEKEIIYGISENSEKGDFFSNVGYAAIKFVEEKTFLLAYYCPTEYVEGLVPRFEKVIEEIETY